MDGTRKLRKELRECAEFLEEVVTLLMRHGWEDEAHDATLAEAAVWRVVDALDSDFDDEWVREWEAKLR